MKKSILQNIITYFEEQNIERQPFHFNNFHEKWTSLEQERILLPKDSPSVLSPKVSSKELALYKQVKKCVQCHLGKIERTFHYGLLDKDKGTDLMLILDIPSMADHLQGNFYGENPTSHLLKNILKAIHYDYLGVFTTSAIKCYSLSELPRDLSRVSVCTNYIKREIELFKPKKILVMGELTYRLLFKEENFDLILGTPLQYQEIDTVVTHHPKQILFQSKYKKEIWNHLKESNLYV